MTTEVQKGSAFLGGGRVFVSFVWIKAYSIFRCLGILFMEEAEEEEGAFQLWPLMLSLIPAVNHWAFTRQSSHSPGFPAQP